MFAQKPFELNLQVFPDYFYYGWFNCKHITDYVILDVRVLKYFHQQGHLQKYEANRRKNTNGLRSELVYTLLHDLPIFR